MTPQALPRHYPAHAAQPFGAGATVPPPRPLGNDRLARMAARRVFVALKHDFMQAVDGLDGERGAWLRDQVRKAEEPEDLLLLRGHVFACLAGADAGRSSTRRSLRQRLDALFPDSAPRSSFLSL